MAPRTRTSCRARISCLALFLLLSLSSASASIACGALEDAERASYRALRWEDFQAAPPPAEREAQLDRTAIRLRSSIRIDAMPIEAREVDGTWLARLVSPCVRAYALKQLSGRLPSARHDWQLAHEQGHFDLTELHARRLAAQLGELTAIGATREAAERALREAIRRAYAEECAAHERAQARYDDATAHGQQRRWQAKWARRIAANLAAEARRGRALSARRHLVANRDAPDHDARTDLIEQLVPCEIELAVAKAEGAGAGLHRELLRSTAAHAAYRTQHSGR